MAAGSETILDKIKAVDLQKINRNFKANFWIITFLITAFLVFLIFDFSSAFIMTFFLAFYWNWILSSKEIRRKSHEKKYSFSFLRFVLILNKVMERLIQVKHPGRKKVTRSLSPLFFFLIIFLGTGEFFLLNSLLGSIYFELVRRWNDILLKRV